MRKIYLFLLILCLAGCSSNSDKTPPAPVGPVRIEAGVGVEQAKLGQTKQEIEANLGEPDERDSNEFAPGNTYAIYYQKGLELIYTDDKLETVALHPAGEKWTAYDGSTPEGLSVHSTPEQVQAKLGEPAEKSPRGLNYQSKGIWFRFDDKGAVESVLITAPQ